jgi:cation diffusion facilitator CzcD-associated flavoprotein CzcO
MTDESSPISVEVGGRTVRWNAELRDAVRAKYAQERDKRLRADGPDQYVTVEADGPFAEFLDHHFDEPRIVRERLVTDVEVLIIGGGFAGLLAGARLRAAGIDDLRIVERGGDFGGTWYWNRYPGAQCDTDAYVYLPLLEEMDYVPTEKYAHAPEIFEHSKAIARRYDLYRNALLQTAVIAMEWDADRSRWRVRTDRDDELSARFIVWGCGAITRPKLPGVPGIETFRGKSFHSSRWDYTYTGGDGNGNLTGLLDKRVAIIGTGATAVQTVPHLGRSKHLYVFERTPSSIDRRDNRPTDPEWAASLQPGWHKERVQNYTNVLSGVPVEEDLVNDGWTDAARRTWELASRAPALTPEQLADLTEAVDFEKMESVRRRVDSMVHDPAVAEGLKAYYRRFCKRPCFHDAYLDTFTRPNVTLVNTDGQGVERITERGVVAGGAEYDIDLIVFATGFESRVTEVTRKAGIEVRGRNGVRLSERWNPPRTFFAAHVREFPNLFFITYTAGGPATANVTHSIDVMAEHITYVISKAIREGIAAVEPTEAAVAEWVETCASSAVALQQQRNGGECTPGYLNNEGHAVDRHLYVGTMVSFLERIEGWRANGNLDGLELTYAEAGARA